jgi:hypothetical protein
LYTVLVQNWTRRERTNIETKHVPDEGSKLGSLDGSELGLDDGVELGDAEGVEEGEIDGFCDGSTDGVNDGLDDGPVETLGLELGDDVGFNVGIFVIACCTGAGVGWNVGTGVNVTL